MGRRASINSDERGLTTRAVVPLNVPSPPLVMTREDVDFIVRTLRESIETAMAPRRSDGPRQ